MWTTTVGSICYNLCVRLSQTMFYMTWTYCDKLWWQSIAFLVYFVMTNIFDYGCSLLFDVLMRFIIRKAFRVWQSNASTCVTPAARRSRTRVRCARTTARSTSSSTATSASGADTASRSAAACSHTAAAPTWRRRTSRRRRWTARRRASRRRRWTSPWSRWSVARRWRYAARCRCSTRTTCCLWSHSEASHPTVSLWHSPQWGLASDSRHSEALRQTLSLRHSPQWGLASDSRHSEASHQTVATVKPCVRHSLRHSPQWGVASDTILPTIAMVRPRVRHSRRHSPQWSLAPDTLTSTLAMVRPRVRHSPWWGLALRHSRLTNKVGEPIDNTATIQRSMFSWCAKGPLFACRLGLVPHVNHSS